MTGSMNHYIHTTIVLLFNLQRTTRSCHGIWGASAASITKTLEIDALSLPDSPASNTKESPFLLGDDIALIKKEKRENEISLLEGAKVLSIGEGPLHNSFHVFVNDYVTASHSGNKPVTLSASELACNPISFRCPSDDGSDPRLYSLAKSKHYKFDNTTTVGRNRRTADYGGYDATEKGPLTGIRYSFSKTTNAKRKELSRRVRLRPDWAASDHHASSSSMRKVILMHPSPFDTLTKAVSSHVAAEYLQSSLTTVTSRQTAELDVTDNVAPVAVDDSVNTPEDIAVTIHVMKNDFDTDDNLDKMSCSLLTPPKGGAATLKAGCIFVYTPTRNYNGRDSFVYQICDTLEACDSATVLIEVTGVNDHPTAVDDFKLNSEDKSVTINAIQNDMDIEENIDPTSCAVTKAPLGGTVVSNNDCTFTYTPFKDFTGQDIFTYKICDTLGTCDEAFVNLYTTKVDDAPVANDDEVTTSVGVPVMVNVLMNDTDAEKNIDPSSCTLLLKAKNGVAVSNGNCTFTYTPNASFSGSDNFTYQVCDSTALCASATVLITVTSAPNVPFSPTAMPTVKAGDTFSKIPSTTPSKAPTQNLTKASSKAPTQNPTKAPTQNPIKAPSKAPIQNPTKAPSKAPTQNPTKAPTQNLTKAPTQNPIKAPSKAPTQNPTKAPSKAPTQNPTKAPSTAPTQNPTKAPIKVLAKPPSGAPVTITSTKSKTKKSASRPTRSPTTEPSGAPMTKSPINRPTTAPASYQTKKPTKTITKAPTEGPTNVPTNLPTKKLTESPIKTPSGAPGTVPPTEGPVNAPLGAPVAVSSTEGSTNAPSTNPTKKLTKAPTVPPSGALVTVPPTEGPVNAPSGAPVAVSSTEGSTNAPSTNPTKKPTKAPTVPPSGAPVTVLPTAGPTVTATKIPTKKPTMPPTKNITRRPTNAPSRNPTRRPIRRPTKKPTHAPTETPSNTPVTISHTASPTKAPTRRPTKAPARRPTKAPTRRPTKAPTHFPTKAPTDASTTAPTHSLTKAPSGAPVGISATASSTNAPTSHPTDAPTDVPSEAPSLTLISISPTGNSTMVPTSRPTTTDNSTSAPVFTPSDSPMKGPTTSSIIDPTDDPTTAPTDSPTATSTYRPTNIPNDGQAKVPTDSPASALNDVLTKAPTVDPTAAPNGDPVRVPTKEPVVDLTTAPSLTIEVIVPPTTASMSTKSPSTGSIVTSSAPTAAPTTKLIATGNRLPVATDDTVTTNEDVPVSVLVSTNDSDPNDTLDLDSCKLVNAPKSGRAAGSGRCMFIYTPNRNFHGQDTFTYKICNTLELCNEAMVAVVVKSVNDPPQAVDDFKNLTQDTVVTIHVGKNDIGSKDSSLDLKSCMLVAAPSHGTATPNGDCTFEYTPQPAYSGHDRFTYKICNKHKLCDEAFVNLWVSKVTTRRLTEHKRIAAVVARPKMYEDSYLKDGMAQRS